MLGLRAANLTRRPCVEKAVTRFRPNESRFISCTVHVYILQPDIVRPCSTFPPVQISVVSFVSRVLTLVFSSLFFVRSSFLFYSLRFKKRKDTFYNFSILSLFIVSKNTLLYVIYRSTVLFSSSLIRNGRNKLLLSSNFRSAQREAIFLPPSPRGKHRDFGLSTE